MGEIREKITLVNSGDLGAAHRRCIKIEDVRQVTVDVVVATGTVVSGVAMCCEGGRQCY